MAETLVSDVIVPAIFIPYSIQRTAEKSELVQSGVIDTDPQFASLAGDGGATVNMPFWNDLSGDDQVLSDTVSLTTKKIGTAQDVACIHNRADAWSTNDLAGILAGSDPMEAIISLVADYWARKMQATTIATLNGIFAAANMSGLVRDIYLANADPFDANVHTLNGLTFIDAKQLLGDAKDKLSTIIVHSAVEASLLKNDLIDFMPDSEGKPTIKTFQGARVIMDDGVPTETINGRLVYTTYIFARGALALGVWGGNKRIEGGHGTWAVEFFRGALAGQNGFINRRRFILHPRGVKWLGAVQTGHSPTNVELANANNWTRVYEVKNLRIVRVRHNLP